MHILSRMQEIGREGVWPEPGIGVLWLLFSSARDACSVRCRLVRGVNIFGDVDKTLDDDREWFTSVMTRLDHGLAVSDFSFLNTHWWSTDAGHRYLPSTARCQLTVPSTRTIYRDLMFSVHGSAVWNSLPYNLRSMNISTDTFSKKN